MKVGLALPTMAPGVDRAAMVAWCEGIDAGPFSSISAGERFTFLNPEMLTTMAAAAALTERVEVMVNVAVLPLHQPAVIAKQLSTIDVLSGGRLVVGAGVGGRIDDYRAAGVQFTRRHAVLEERVGQLRAIWSGEPPFDGADPVGPFPVGGRTVPILAGALGPKSIARAATWADGVTGFSLGPNRDEIASLNDKVRTAFRQAGRDLPTLINGSFVTIGVDDARAQLHAFASRYLGFFGDEVAAAIASGLRLSSDGAVRTALDDAAAAGCDEFILVPGTWDLGCLRALDAVVGDWVSSR